ncbi:lipopolysaccharide biosynthesis protein [Helicobacter pylori]|uniref:Lipopolysaccharide biosynthesis protein n=1 Tax=Helicobacter pylori TaxID=210 RepID=A0A4Y4W6P7_HELPX|nr:glycosyltransferase family 8 protein [Helicobacter pylori]OOQ01834.1 lipopolysaccharide biosynthesis protein [Helicobacter pylori]OOQ22760.1 lipopolysaccharide biosynthesis protein [Helicobacter pylori]OOQ35851.1 lipopolysaccharide biosynthesis protein [Helicobacter pylori]
MQEVIPVVVAFDNNYCIPAGVSLYSMLAHAKRERERESKTLLSNPLFSGGFKPRKCSQIRRNDRSF